MKLLALLIPVICLVGFAAFVWLTVVAFKRSPLWGVLVLLLSPIAAVVFAVKHWQESKKPFLIYAGSAALCFVFVVAMIAMGGFAMMAMAKAAQEQQFGEQPMNEMPGDAVVTIEGSGMPEPGAPDHFQERFEEVQEPADAGAPRASIEVLPGSAGSDPDEEDLAGAIQALRVHAEPAPKATYAAPGGVIPLHRAGDFVGQFMRVKLNDGSEYRGMLASLGANQLELNRNLPSGVLTIHVDRKQVQVLQLTKP
jgi:hypothetical protein